MKKTLDNIKFTYNFASTQKIRIIKYAILSSFLSIASVIIPFISAQQIIQITSGLYQQLIVTSIIIFIVESLRNLMNHFNEKTSQIIYRETLINLQKELAKEMLKIQTSAIDQHSSGVFIQRLSSDASQISDVFYSLNETLTSIIADLGILVAVFFINKIIFMYFIIVMTILFIFQRIRIKKIEKKDKEYREVSENTSGLTGELIRGIRDIKMLNAENSCLNEFTNKVKNLNIARYNMSDVSRKYRLINRILENIFNLSLIILLIYLLKNNSLALANAIIIYNYNGRIKSVIYSINSIMEHLINYNLSCERVYELMKENEKFPKEKFGQKRLEKIKGDFEFKNVSFSYNEKKVLDNVNFKVNANSTVAFVGKSGSGKTTIFNLLCKMYDVNSGKILIDGIDIKELDKDSIRGNITIINQNPYIFNMSIKDNLKLVKSDITEEEMKEACRLACLDEFIEKLEKGYDTMIGEGGVTLSGGQKQRLAIARAFIQKTEIILFDEATSALDNETQKQIQKAIENLKKEYTILIIAHRLSTIINADYLIYIEDGKIIAKGSHKQLLESCAGYKNLYEMEIEK